jgi:hypothetical protein
VRVEADHETAHSKQLADAIVKFLAALCSNAYEPTLRIEDTESTAADTSPPGLPRRTADAYKEVRPERSAGTQRVLSCPAEVAKDDVDAAVAKQPPDCYDGKS